MIWTFEILEISNGLYSCKGMRDTGNIVSFQCGELDIYRIFKRAYELEVDLGSLPSKALCLVVSGAKPNWKSQYHGEAFGSWIVISMNQRKRFVYDGKDFLLMIYESDANPIWQGLVKEKNDAADIIFQTLQRIG